MDEARVADHGADAAQPVGPPDDQRLAVLFDKSAIADLINGYGLAVDRRDRAALEVLFDDDALLALAAPSDAGEPEPLARGNAKIAAYIVSLTQPGGAHYPGPTAHVVGPSVITLEGDNAHAHTRCVASHLNGVEGGEMRQRTSYLRYADTFVRRGPGWVISRRVICHDFIEDRPAAPLGGVAR